jgi:hypothetical protein
MSDTAYISAPKRCDLHPEREAKYDFRTTGGSWMNGCQGCFEAHGTGKLGTGYGQRLVVGEPPERTDADIRAEIMEAAEAGDFDAMEDAIGDRDIAEFL